MENDGFSLVGGGGSVGLAADFYPMCHGLNTALIEKPMYCGQIIK
ncbi:MAG: hypothetical protein P8012_02580 [Desulfobacterales bacterium]